MSKERRIIPKCTSKPRKGWEKAFKQMHDNGDDCLIIDDVFDDDAFDEWTKDKPETFKLLNS